jgi:hypothetical protein
MSTYSTTETCIGWTFVLPAQSDQPYPSRLISRVLFLPKSHMIMNRPFDNLAPTLERCRGIFLAGSEMAAA